MLGLGLKLGLGLLYFLVLMWRAECKVTVPGPNTVAAAPVVAEFFITRFPPVRAKTASTV